MGKYVRSVDFHHPLKVVQTVCQKIYDVSYHVKYQFWLWQTKEITLSGETLSFCLNHKSYFICLKKNWFCQTKQIDFSLCLTMVSLLLTKRSLCQKIIWFCQWRWNITCHFVVLKVSLFWWINGHCIWWIHIGDCSLDHNVWGWMMSFP